MCSFYALVVFEINAEVLFLLDKGLFSAGISKTCAEWRDLHSVDRPHGYRSCSAMETHTVSTLQLSSQHPGL